MTSLSEKLSHVVGQVFVDSELPAELGQVRVSDRPDLAQFQCNGAMAAAKLAKKNPREIANDVVGKLQTQDVFSKVDIAGPGFINIDVTDDFLSAHLEMIRGDARLGAGNSGQDQTVVLDYGGPNIAKPMHVGHLRAAIIGDSVRRIMKFAGFNTLGDVHMGDWGTHMGMIISEFIKTGDTDRILNLDLEDEAQIDALMKELGEMYPRVAGQCKEDEARKEEARLATVKLQNKEEPYYGLLAVIKAASVNGMRRNYATLGVHFEDDGALIIPVKIEEDKKEVPPLILYKRDGGVMYGTTDMATLVEREKLYNPTRVVYVVDQRQHLHFEQVFRAAKLTGIVPAATELTHAGFGTMNGTDGKPFKTRAGGVMKLEDLIAMAEETAMKRLNEAALAEDMDADEKADVAHKVGIAAIKFADLSNPRVTDYVFDLERLTSFEGKTGPYLLYQAVRIKSLLKKAEAQGLSILKADAFAIGDADRALALLLTEFPDAFNFALRDYMPHHLCEYAYRVASTFSSFYGNCHILSEEDEAVRNSRLALCAFTYEMLIQILDLLGIEVPERM